MKFSQILSICSIVPGLLAAEIFETSSFSSLLTHLETGSSEKVLVICDIDNTLLRSSHALGSVAWADFLIDSLQQKGISTLEAQMIENILWRAVQPHIKVECIDQDTPKILKTIQERNIPMIALTARAPEEQHYTFDQLTSVGIDFSPIHQTALVSPLNRDSERILFERGVMFCTPFKRKSDVLFAFLENFWDLPRKIIFVDDKWGHVEDLERECRLRGIDYTGIRFGGADGHVEKFNPHLAAVQWGAFPLILSDEEAEQILISREFLISEDLAGFKN